MSVGLPHFLVVAALLFAFGFFTVATRRNAVGILMGVELILNAANINFVAFSRYGTMGNPTLGQIFPVFGIMVGGVGGQCRRRVKLRSALIMRGLVLLLAIAGCGVAPPAPPPVPGTPTGTFAVTVTATSTGFTATTSFNLVVQ